MIRALKTLAICGAYYAAPIGLTLVIVAAIIAGENL